MNRLNADQWLIVEEKLISSNKLFELKYQSDGNLVLYREGTPIWASNTINPNPGAATMQGDGNFILYTADGVPYWSTNTFGEGYYLILQNDGNVVLYDSNNEWKWQTDTDDPSIPTLPTYRQIVGQLTYDESRLCIKDDNGPILPSFLHLGDGRALFSVSPDTIHSICEQAVQYQYTGILSWSILNDENEQNPWYIPPYFWLGPKHQSDFWQKTEDYANTLKSYGLRWLCPMGGLGMFNDLNEAKEFVNRFCDVIERVGFEWFVWETVNELLASSPSRWHNPDWIDQLTDIPRSRFPRMICMTSSLGGVEDPNELAPYNRKTQLVSNHQFRGFHVGNKADHPWTFGFEAIPKIRALNGNQRLHRGWNTEPCGPFSNIDAEYGPGKVRAYVSVQENGHRGQEFNDRTLGYIAAKSVLGGNAFNYFSAPGVKFFDGANFEDYPGFKNVGKLIQMLPQDIWTYEWLGHGNPDRPWSHMRIFHPEDYARADGFWANDGRFANALGGINNLYDREFDYQVLKNCRFTLVDTGSLNSWSVEKRAGDILRTGMAVVFGSTV